MQSTAQKLAATGAAALVAAALNLAPPALANEFDILGEPTPTANYVVDDASALSKSTRSELQKKLKILETETGYRLEVVTVRKLEFETDAFAFGDKVLETWYPTAEQGSQKGLLLVVTSGKEGAISGGANFLKALGDDLLESIVTDDVPIYTEQEKYNAAVLSSVDRIEAQLQGREVPEGPKRNDTSRQRTYKTKEETEKSKGVTATVVGTLLLIAVVVPMLQYYGYTARD